MTRAAGTFALGYRLAWLFGWLAFIGFGLASIAIYVAMHLMLFSKERHELDSKASLMRHVLAETERGELTAMRHKLDDILVGHGDLRMVITDLTPGREEVYRSPAVGPWSGTFREANYEVPWKADGSLLLVNVRMDTSDNAGLLLRLAWTLGITTVVCASVIALGGFWLVRFGLAPLRDLARQTSMLRADRLDQRLSVRGQAEELAPWIGQLNQLLERLQLAYHRLDGFSADVAHELRTPLAVLMSRCELELSRDRSNAQLRDAIGANLDDLRNVAGIVNDMLFLSHAEAGDEAHVDSPAAVGIVVAQVVDLYDAALDEAGVSVDTWDDGSILMFDRGLMKRALSNLLGNAVRYAERGTAIAVKIRTVDGLCHVSVENRGDAIPAEALPRLFDRFYRLDRARDRSSVHHGLGLAIVAAVARMHGGCVFAESANGTTKVGLIVPVEKPVRAADRAPGAGRTAAVAPTLV